MAAAGPPALTRRSWGRVGRRSLRGRDRLCAGCWAGGAGGAWRPVLAVLVVVAVVVVVVLATRTSSTKPTSSVPVTGVVAVQRRDLVETDTESGTIGYANPQTVYDRLGGTITWLPSVGQLIKPGQRLFGVDGEPVILMNGTTPAYRDLTAGDSDGQDILELNRNLVDLGFDPDRIVDRRCLAAGDDRRCRGVPGVAGRDRDRQPVARSGRVPAGRADRRGGRGEPRRSAVGQHWRRRRRRGATPILQTTSTRLIVTVDLAASSQSEARVGEQVAVEMPAGNVVDGVITAVSPVAASSSSSSSAAAGGSSSSRGDDPGDDQAEGTRQRGGVGSGAGQRELRAGGREQRAVGSGHRAAGDLGRWIRGAGSCGRRTG